MGRALKSRLESFFPADSLGLRLLQAAAALITIATGLAVIVGIVFSEPVRDALSNFLTANVEVWHLLVAAGGLIVVGLIVMRLRRSGSRPRRVDRSRYAPKEIPRYDVLWPITAHLYEAPKFTAGKPRCPKCRTPLGLDFGEGREPVQLPDGKWKDVPSEGMTFRCHKDGLAYDLTKYKLAMHMMIKNVEGEAMGIYDTALREAGL